MNSEERKNFEKLMTNTFKSLTRHDLELKFSKNKITLLFGKEKQGEIYVQHLTKANGYYAGLEIYSCDAMSFCLEQNPPYASRLLNSSFLSKASLSETGKQFGDKIGGTVRVPSVEEFTATAERIRERLDRIYLPLAHRCITAPAVLLDDILDSPDDFAFPFLSALYVAYRHRISFTSPQFQKVINSKKITGNRDFDLPLAKNLLAGPPEN